MANHQNHQNQALACGLNSSQVVVVMVPLPAQGHLNQLLHLSRLISAYDIPVHFVGAATHNRQAKLRVHGWNPNSATNFHFHDISVPPFPCPPPDPTAPKKFPSQILPSIYATRHLRDPVRELVGGLSSQARRVIVIYDSGMATVVQDVVSIPNAEAYPFHSVSAFAMFLYLWEGMGTPLEEEAKRYVPDDVPSLEDCLTSDFMDFLNGQYQLKSIASGNLFYANRAMEKPYIDLMDGILPDKKNWAIGPFNPVEFSKKKAPNDRHMCLEWLDKQAPKSVIYVSFGTTTSFTEEEIEELALGLEHSKQKFIWVLREADKGDVFGEVRKIELPKEYEERVRNMGIVVRDWVPQLEILGHPSTGGFLSHCGWNSCLESITMGVPIGAWPMHSDQPRNTVLITKVLKVGTVVRDWSRRNEVAAADTIGEGVKKLMASEEGEEMRKRAKELGGAIRRSVAEGGASRLEFDSFIAHITRP
ncbi:hypothetical protein TIFTF001_053655 [Ficus carica]|uniref:Glycosyltransferase n=1 Tax=Ficus carica TaxID=3494 RepID=A0AA88EEK9_FICCA|nr:hypothetical protein TIFTF001_053652 [Ficus carica]GMN73188.1 hypothetical protein TIFTF001_053653 [Ficus carica]GMN73190.1 hypothetical protein TIFTF001_053654 [Ficus carica]GMN73193.1 hypothetical protein TIFTF001_053655 [Ficus carica]